VARNSALAAARLAADARDPATRARLEALVQEVSQAAQAAEVDQKLLAKLVDIRSAEADDLDGSETDLAYGEAFREAGLDVAELSPAEAEAKIQTRLRTVVVDIRTALDDWAAVRRDRRSDQAGARRLSDIARLADPDPWRNRLRELLQARKSPERLANLRALAKSAWIDELPAVSLSLLGKTLLGSGDPAAAEIVLRAGRHLHPGDVWLNYGLAQCLGRLRRREEAIRYFIAARSLRPETAHALAHALEQNGEIDQAIAVFQDLSQLRPKDSLHFTCLGTILKASGRTQEATVALDAAMLAARGQVELRPRQSLAHASLGRALFEHGKPIEAIAEYREAIRLMPNDPGTHNNLGLALRDQKKLAEAIAEYREAIRLQPDDPGIRNNLGNVLQGQGKLAEAIAEYREAIRLKPDYAPARNGLGNALYDQGKLAEAIAEYREAIRLKPNDPFPHNNLGNALKDQGKLAEAIAEYREAIRLQPDDSHAHHNLGLAVGSRGDFAQASAELRRALDLVKTNPRLAQQVQRELAATERQASLDARLPEVLAGRLKPSDTTEMLGFAQLCYEKKLQNASARFWSQAFQAQPKLADDVQVPNRYNAACAAALAGCGQGKDEPAPDEAAKARWRKQATDWLKADLVAWSKILDSGPPQARQAISQTLQHWKADSDLAGLRDEAGLAKLPADEQEAYHALWDEVNRLLKRAQSPPSR
jgi:Flp pilus assembly protein TadD